jgi:type I restriction enzyme, S subunit
LKQYAVRPNDILMSCVGTFGKIAVVPASAAPGIINPRLIRLRCAGGVDPEYMVDVLRSRPTFEQLNAATRGGTMDTINKSVLMDLWLALPPEEEQRAVHAHLNAAGSRIDTLIDEANRGIDLLRERRTALISAVVTGQIDVRALAAQGTVA